MTKNFFPGFDEYMEERHEQSQSSYDLKILKLLFKTLLSDREFKATRAEAGDEFDLNWFNDMGVVPIFIFARKHIVVNPAQILSTAGFTKTQLWAAYFEEKNKMPKGKAMAMFFPIVRMGQFVIHNANCLPAVPGHNVVMRHGSTTEMVLRVEHSRSFLAALAMQYK
jgi:hypothetical protein